MPNIQVKQRPLLTRVESFQHVSPFLAHILARRGVASEQELELRLKYLLSPCLKGLEQAVEIITSRKKLLLSEIMMQMVQPALL